MVDLAAVLALLLAATEPSAPVAPEPPLVNGPALPSPAAPAPSVAEPVRPAEAASPAGAATSAATPSPDPAAAPPPEKRGADGAVQRAEANAAPARKESRPPVPALTPRALSDELRRSARERAKEQARLEAERERLARQAKEIAEARAALKEETARLEGLLGKGAGGPGKAGTSGEAAPLDALARTVKGMKAEQAAALLTRLDRALAAAILERMRPADAAVVMDKLDPSVGAQLFALLTRSGR